MSFVWLPLVCISSPALCEQPSDIKLGFLYLQSGPGAANNWIDSWVQESFSQFKLGILDVNADPSILPNHTLSFEIADTGRSEAIALKGVTTLLKRVVGIVGTGYSIALRLPGSYCSAYQKPVVSPGSTLISLSDKEHMPYVLRSIASDAGILKAMAATIYDLGWRKSVLMADKEFEDGAIQVLRLAMSSSGIRGLTIIYSSTVNKRRELQEDMNSIKSSGYRIIALYSKTSDFAVINETSWKAGVGFWSQEYVWVCRSPSCVDELHHAAGVFSVLSQRQSKTARKIWYDDRWTKVTTLWNASVHGGYDPNTGLPFFGPNATRDYTVWDTANAEKGDGKPDKWGEYVYDTVWLYAHALHMMLLAGHDTSNGEELRNQLLKTELQGVTGKLVFDQRTQDRIEPIVIKQASVNGPFQVGRGTKHLETWDHKMMACTQGCTTLTPDTVSFPGAIVPSDGRDLDVQKSFFYSGSRSYIEGKEITVIVQVRNSFGQVPCENPCSSTATSRRCTGCLERFANYKKVVPAFKTLAGEVLQPAQEPVYDMQVPAGVLHIVLPEGLPGAGNQDRDVFIQLTYKSVSLGRDHHLTLVSNACTPGFVEVNGTCSACQAGTFTASRGATECVTCPAGTFSEAQSASCAECKAGSYSNAGRCITCSWDTWAEKGSGQCMSCADDFFAAYMSNQCVYYCSNAVILALVVLLLGYILPVAFGLPVPIADVSVQDNKLIVTTTQPHGIRWGLTPVHFRGTGHRGLDKPSEPFSGYFLGLYSLSLHKVPHHHHEPHVAEQYTEWATYITESQIGWVHVRYLRECAATGRMIPRRQDVPPEQLKVGSFGTFEQDCKAVTRWVLSHPWCSTRHPDPDGRQLKWIVSELDRLGSSDADLIFYDFMSIYQHDFSDDDLWRTHTTRVHQTSMGMLEEELEKWPGPGEHPSVRTEEEQRLFEMGLNRSELLYSFFGSKVIIVPAPPDAGEVQRDVIPGYPAYTRLYMNRGWCFLEICASRLFGTIANTDSALVKNLWKKLPRNPEEFEKMFFRKVKFSFAGDADVVCEMFARLYHNSPEGHAKHHLSCFEVVDEIYASAGTLRIPFPYMLRSVVFHVVPVVLMTSVLVFYNAILIMHNRFPLKVIFSVVLCCGAVALIFQVFRFWFGYQKTPFGSRRSDFKKILRQQHRKPDGYGSCSNRSMAAGDVWDLHEFFKDCLQGRRDIRYVCNYIVTPLTARERLSYAEIVGPESRDQFWFASYSRRQSFSVFAKSVMTHAKTVAPVGLAWRKVRYWIEDLCRNAWEDGAQSNSWDSPAAIATVLNSRSCKGTVVFLDERVLPLRSIPCLFEIASSFARQAREEKFHTSFCTALGFLHNGGAACSVLWALAEATAALNQEELNEEAFVDDQDDIGFKEAVLENLQFLKQSIDNLMDTAMLSVIGDRFRVESGAGPAEAEITRQSSAVRISTSCAVETPQSPAEAELRRRWNRITAAGALTSPAEEDMTRRFRRLSAASPVAESAPGTPQEEDKVQSSMGQTAYDPSPSCGSSLLVITPESPRSLASNSKCTKHVV